MIPKTEKVKYLGSQLTSTMEDILYRKNLATNAFWKMKKIWNSKNITLKLKLRIFNSTCVAIFLYASETWVLNPEREKKINSFATTCYRYILGISKFDKVRNEEIYKKVGQEQLTEKIKRRQKNFIMNTLSLQNNDMIKKYLIYYPKKGKRKRGRAEKLYGDQASILMGNQAHLLDELLVT